MRIAWPGERLVILAADTSQLPGFLSELASQGRQSNSTRVSPVAMCTRLRAFAVGATIFTFFFCRAFYTHGPLARASLLKEIHCSPPASFEHNLTINGSEFHVLSVERAWHSVQHRSMNPERFIFTIFCCRLLPEYGAKSRWMRTFSTQYRFGF
jgi:hypothetical protein